jgi:hypothetical protein
MTKESCFTSSGRPSAVSIHDNSDMGWYFIFINHDSI